MGETPGYEPDQPQTVPRVDQQRAEEGVDTTAAPGPPGRRGWGCDDQCDHGFTSFCPYCG